MKTRKHSRLFEMATRRKTLWNAWHKVKSNGLSSKSEITRNKIREFDKNAEKNIKAIQYDIRHDKFDFSGNKTIYDPKKPKSRPLVIAPVRIRIIQRSLLDVLQKQKNIKKYLELPTSFGAIEGKGVPGAVSEIYRIVNKKSKKFFIRSDIKSFFTKIKLNVVIETIAKEVSAEKDFIELLNKSTKLEMADLAKIKNEHRVLFDFDLEGSPQGCSLSPLVANIFLYDFDIKMNTAKFSCIRYLDDFVILADNEKIGNIAFKSAKEILSNLCLEVHDLNNSKKSSHGHVNSGFDFLGVEFDFKNNFLRPSSENRKKFKENLSKLLNDSRKAIKSAESIEDKSSVTSTLYYVNNIIKGWGNTFYKACESSIDKATFGSLDKDISKIVDDYIENVYFILSKNNIDWKIRRKKLGLHLLI